MTMRYGPFSPLPEVAAFLVFVLANILIGREEVLNAVTRRYLWDVGLVLVFLSLVTILCVRAVKRRAMEKAFSTAAIFGIFAGSMIWCLYVATEMVSEGHSLNYQAIVSAVEYGLVCGAIALVLSAVEILIYGVIRGKVS